MKLSGLVVVLFLLILSAGTAFAASVPTEGVVTEGVGVPGIALGFTRAEVITSYGPPTHCQGIYSDFCHYDLPEGDIFIHYSGPNGGNVTGTDEDVLHQVYWYRLSGWVTTAGVNTDLALENPDAVIAAYPNAIVTYNQFGQILSVTDYPLGIAVDWVRTLYPLPSVQTRIRVFYPRDPPVPPEPTLHSSWIALRVHRNRVEASVWVNDIHNGSGVEGAVVSATWTLPKGRTMAVTGTTNNYGEVLFEIKKSHGTYVFTIDDITKEGYVFDADNSVLSAQIEVTGKGGN